MNEEEEEQFPEGRILYREHRCRERNKKLVEKAKENASLNGQLECVICGFNFFRYYGEIGKGFIECHHTVPVSEYDVEKTTS
ncbi:MAG: HNH endonuclease [Mobilitalea sp.]